MVGDLAQIPQRVEVQRAGLDRLDPAGAQPREMRRRRVFLQAAKHIPFRCERKGSRNVADQEYGRRIPKPIDLALA